MSSWIFVDCGRFSQRPVNDLFISTENTRKHNTGLQIWRSGTHCQMNSEIRRVMLTASNSSLKQSRSAFTMRLTHYRPRLIFNVMRSKNLCYVLLTHLLTYDINRQEWLISNILLCCYFSPRAHAVSTKFYEHSVSPNSLSDFTFWLDLSLADLT